MQYHLTNGIIERIFDVSEHGVRTVSLKDLRHDTEYIHAPVREYAFAIDDTLYSSYGENRVREVDGNREEFSLLPVLTAVRQNPDSLELEFDQGPVRVTLCYRIYPGVCGTRKHLIIRNRSRSAVRLSNVVFDDTSAAPGSFSSCDYYAGSNDRPQSICFTLEGSDDIVRCHDPEQNAGWIMGSTAPGLLRYFLVYPHWHNAICGLNMSGAPFAKDLNPGESFETPDSVFALYRGDKNDPETVRGFRSLIRAGLPAMKDREGVMFCTWLPFLKNIDSELTRELAEQAAAMGFRTFVLDDGWFNGNDRQVDPAKFPHGLEELSGQVHRAGMRFGLWLNVGTDYGLMNMPEKWFLRRADGKPGRLGFDYSKSHNIFCLGSGYRHWIADELDRLAGRYGVQYFKLDFSSIASPYGITPWGCHSTEHEYHRTWEDSFMAIYEGMKSVRDHLLERHPETTLDFSFEAFGTETPNIAALELSELHHVSNHSANDPSSQSIERVRKNFYAWLGKLPPERILNGLLSIQGERGAEYLLSSFAGAPLVAGDLRKLSEEQRRRLKRFTQAFNEAAALGPMTEFRMLENEPDFDSFLRIGSDGHGIACCFNRTDRARVFRCPENLRFVNVETGAEDLFAAAHDCSMFTIIGQGKNTSGKQ